MLSRPWAADSSSSQQSGGIGSLGRLGGSLRTATAAKAGFSAQSAAAKSNALELTAKLTTLAGAATNVAANFSVSGLGGALSAGTSALSAMGVAFGPVGAGLSLVAGLAPLVISAFTKETEATESFTDALARLQGQEDMLSRVGGLSSKGAERELAAVNHKIELAKQARGDDADEASLIESEKVLNSLYEERAALGRRVEEARKKEAEELAAKNEAYYANNAALAKELAIARELTAAYDERTQFQKLAAQEERKSALTSEDPDVVAKTITQVTSELEKSYSPAVPSRPGGARGGS